MIDTDKYYGHTPPPWEIHGERICAQDACEVGNVGGDVAIVIDEVNAHLIADAPLLLEEVKRLRETIKVAITDLEQTNLHEETREDLLDLLKEMIK